VNDLHCPWCEAAVTVLDDADAVEQTCPECLTSWMYESVESQQLVPAA
jgi:Zn-finger nucleic acid-binding protein